MIPRLIGLFVASVLAGWSLASRASTPEALSVSQKGTQFLPGTLTVNSGGVIRITNDDPFVHHVYVESPGFAYDSGEQRPGVVIAVRMDKPGQHVLQCAIHLKMKLHVTVR
jgi:plastocyanin